MHTGGVEHFAELIRAGYVDVLLAGNALAVHDVEQALFGTSLGIDLETGKPIEGGHRHHMRAINTICRAGGLRAGRRAGRAHVGRDVRMHPHGVDFVLAGSIRDDGPLPDTVMDLLAAQDRYAAALEDVQLVLVLSTMLHGIGVGNMLPSWVRVVCVDINPAVVTKLADRGSIADRRRRHRRRACSCTGSLSDSELTSEIEDSDCRFQIGKSRRWNV